MLSCDGWLYQYFFSMKSSTVRSGSCSNDLLIWLIRMKMSYFYSAIKEKTVQGVPCFAENSNPVQYNSAITSLDKSAVNNMAGKMMYNNNVQIMLQ